MGSWEEAYDDMI